MGADGFPHQVNEKLVKASAGGEYTATLPAMSTMKPVPLLKCVLMALECAPDGALDCAPDGS
jgi:hypothetical protein